jgi:hypothetical protein
VTDYATDLPTTPLRRLDNHAYDLAWAWQSPVGESVADFFLQIDNPIGRAIARRLAVSGARAIATRISDDWANLAALEDGTIVSVVGRVRAAKTFSFRVSNRPVVGLVLRFPMRELHDFGGTTARPQRLPKEQRKLGWHVDKVDLEAAHNFDLVGPSGQRVPILVDGARLMAKPTFPLRHVAEGRVLLDAMDLPADADRTDVRGAFLWEETLVEVIGPKNNVSGGAGPSITIGDTDEPPTLIIPRALPPARDL